MTQLDQLRLVFEDRAHFMHPSTHAHDHASARRRASTWMGA